MSYKLYDSAGFTVTDLGYGVLVRANVAAVETFLQGDDASQLREELESFDNSAAPASLADAHLSNYFTQDVYDARAREMVDAAIAAVAEDWGDEDFGAEARRLIGERE